MAKKKNTKSQPRKPIKLSGAMWAFIINTIAIAIFSWLLYVRPAILNASTPRLEISDTCESLFNNANYEFNEYKAINATLHGELIKANSLPDDSVIVVVATGVHDRGIYRVSSYLLPGKDGRWQGTAYFFMEDNITIFAVAGSDNMLDRLFYHLYEPVTDVELSNQKSIVISNKIYCTVPTRIASTTPEPHATEILDSTEISQDKPVGEVIVTYPHYMSPKSTDLVVLSIYVPIPIELSKLIEGNAEPVNLTIVDIPTESGSKFSIEKNQTYQGTIRVAQSMWAEFRSINIYNESRQVSLQKIHLDGSGIKTTWIWDIRAPDFIGKQNFTILVGFNDTENPVWRGDFEVEVIELTPVPTHTSIPTYTPFFPTATLQPTFTATLTPTYTPTPPINEKIERDIENSPLEFLKWLIPIIIAFLVAVFSAVIRYLLRLRKIRRLENRLRILKAKLQQQIQNGENTSTTIEEIGKLENKIERLKEIRWYELLKDINAIADESVGKVI